MPASSRNALAGAVVLTGAIRANHVLEPIEQGLAIPEQDVQTAFHAGLLTHEAASSWVKILKDF